MEAEYPAGLLQPHDSSITRAWGCITDFGRTSNLISSAKLQEKARLADAEASREDIVLVTDQVFFAVIEAQETLKVAAQTVAARQDLTDQVSALASSKLRSDLDLSFAQVNLSQVKLLQLNAQNDLDAAKATLSAVLGNQRARTGWRYPHRVPAIFHNHLVRSGRREHKHPDLQWVPVYGASLRSRPTGSGCLRADSCASGTGRSRCPDRMAECKHCPTACDRNV